MKTTRPWKKLLIVRFSSIGDIVLTTPVVRCLKNAGYEVHYLTKVQYASILETSPYIDRIWTLDGKLEALIPTLRKERFDGIIDLHKNLRTVKLQVALDLRALSFDKLNFEKWWLVKTKRNHLPDVHIVDRYFKAVAALGIENDGEGLDFFYSPEDKTAIADRLPTTPFVVLVLGAAHRTKQMPLQLLRNLIATIDRPVVLIGGKDELPLAQALIEAPHCTSLVGKCSIRSSAVVIDLAERVITPDTGMMHIAAALKKPISSVWGSTVPEFGMTPYYGKYEVPHSIHEVKGLACRPCSKIGFEECPKGHFRCMRDQKVVKK